METVNLIIDAQDAGRRLDRYLTDAHPHLSRSEIQQHIRSGEVLVGDAAIRRPSHRLREGDTIHWTIPSRPLLNPAPMSLAILYEDDHLVVVDKALDVVVHPGAGTEATTLVEGLLHGRQLAKSDDPARPGVVHRLDRETSGVIAFAKTEHALSQLQHQFASRAVDKQYLAVVKGSFTEKAGMIDAPIGRDPSRPQRMCVIAGGRASQTDFRVLAPVGSDSLILAHLRTGRTHQIRVHFQYIKHAILGDEKYGGKEASRLFLHAWCLRIDHPMDGRRMEFVAEVPQAFPPFDYDALLEERVVRK